MSNPAHMVVLVATLVLGVAVATYLGLRSRRQLQAGRCQAMNELLQVYASGGWQVPRPSAAIVQVDANRPFRGWQAQAGPSTVNLPLGFRRRFSEESPAIAAPREGRPAPALPVALASEVSNEVPQTRSLGEFLQALRDVPEGG